MGTMTISLGYKCSKVSRPSPSSRSRRRDASSRPCRHRQHCAAEHLLETTIQDRLISSPLAAPSLPYHSALKIRKKSAKKNRLPLHF